MIDHGVCIVVVDGLAAVRFDIEFRNSGVCLQGLSDVTNYILNKFWIGISHFGHILFVTSFQQWIYGATACGFGNCD